MIVKIQIPLANTTAGPDRGLVYNEDHSFDCFLQITDELLAVMDGDPRAFFEVSIGAAGTKEEFEILRRLEEQGW